jgi:hypothetical protein
VICDKPPAAQNEPFCALHPVDTEGPETDHIGYMRGWRRLVDHIV